MRIAKSTRAAKKYMALFDDGSVTHFGGAGCGDYIRYSALDPVLARTKRAAYIARHGATETWTDPTTAATLSRFLLWEKPTLESAMRAFKKRFPGI